MKIGKIITIFFAFVIWMSLSHHAKATDVITMDVDSSLTSGTYLCESVQQCYIMVLYAEERGAPMYCNKVSIKRNGRIVWTKNYWPTSI